MAPPSKFTKKICDAICERISNNESLRKICCSEGMPNKDTVQEWLKKHEAFAVQYAHAYKLRAQLLAEEIIELSDAPLSIRDANGKLIPKGDRLAHMRMQLEQRKLQIDARKWTSARGDAKKYGEIKAVEAEDTDIIIHGGLPEPNKE